MQWECISRSRRISTCEVISARAMTHCSTTHKGRTGDSHRICVCVCNMFMEMVMVWLSFCLHTCFYFVCVSLDTTIECVCTWWLRMYVWVGRGNGWLSRWHGARPSLLQQWVREQINYLKASCCSLSTSPFDRHDIILLHLACHSSSKLPSSFSHQRLFLV